jgi:hypothetical protein
MHLIPTEAPIMPPTIQAFVSVSPPYLIVSFIDRLNILEGWQ